ncbi:hypothetical protein BDK51DRAFT_29269 [Blyttiomyces helicus]|uniref:Uncharacterized protein n=1 Tax=Blyttiomyces helicus TaxID=388810 RepID=A0A4P9WIF0_9FUNG|nr:hypothetical protein BDK51DRAFT_29269 [Blyttiomyces helicus]|eukprot:RKO92641.1 hypothetical protein BDK51DRAFT_29269 [Blyttiomyces helicus]
MPLKRAPAARLPAPSSAFPISICNMKFASNNFMPDLSLITLWVKNVIRPVRNSGKLQTFDRSSRSLGAITFDLEGGGSFNVGDVRSGDDGGSRAGGQPGAVGRAGEQLPRRHPVNIGRANVHFHHRHMQMQDDEDIRLLELVVFAGKARSFYDPSMAEVRLFSKSLGRQIEAGKLLRAARDFRAAVAAGVNVAKSFTSSNGSPRSNILQPCAQLVVASAYHGTRAEEFFQCFDLVDAAARRALGKDLLPRLRRLSMGGVSADAYEARELMLASQERQLNERDRLLTQSINDNADLNADLYTLEREAAMRAQVHGEEVAKLRNALSDAPSSLKCEQERVRAREEELVEERALCEMSQKRTAELEGQLARIEESAMQRPSVGVYSLSVMSSFESLYKSFHGLMSPIVRDKEFADFGTRTFRALYPTCPSNDPSKPMHLVYAAESVLSEFLFDLLESEIIRLSPFCSILEKASGIESSGLEAPSSGRPRELAAIAGRAWGALSRGYETGNLTQSLQQDVNNVLGRLREHIIKTMPQLSSPEREPAVDRLVREAMQLRLDMGALDATAFFLAPSGKTEAYKSWLKKSDLRRREKPNVCAAFDAEKMDKAPSRNDDDIVRFAFFPGLMMGDRCW